MTVTISHPGGTTAVDPTNFEPSYVVTPIVGSGDYLVIWGGTSMYGSQVGSFAQRFNASGDKVGGPIAVSVPTTAYGFTATATSDGGFIFFHNYGNGAYDVYAQRFSANGALVGTESKVNATPGGGVSQAVTLTDGSFVFLGTAGSTPILQKVSASGTAVGGEITPENNWVGGMKLIALANGGFMALWSSHHPSDSQQNIYAQIYNGSGAAVGGQIAVTTGTANKQLPTAAVLSDGSIVIAWDVLDYPGTVAVYAQKYTSAGVANGAAFQVNTTPAAANGAAGIGQPAITALDNGGFAIAWALPNGSSGAVPVYAQAFTAAGAKSGAELPIGSAIGAVSVAELSGAGFAVLWTDGNQHLQSTVVVPTSVTPLLTTGVDYANGDGANDVFQAAPNTLTSGDKLDGGAGTDTLQLTTTGTLNFAGVTLTSVETVTGTAGNDTFIFPKAPFTGVALNSGGGSDTLVMSGAVNLATLSLTGAWTVKTVDGGNAVFTVSSLAQLGMIDGHNANVTVVATSLALTDAQILAALAQGIDEIRLADGLVVSRSGISQLLEAHATAQNAPMADVTAWSSALPDGGYLTTYVAYDGSRDFYIQRFDADGNYIGDLKKVIDTPTASVSAAQTLVLAGGDYIIFWTTFQGGVGYDQHAQRFSIEGIKLGGEISLGHTESDPGGTQVVALPDGGFLVSHYALLSGNLQTVIGHYDGQGQLLGTIAGRPLDDIAVLADGSYIEVWRDYAGNGAIRVQHYSETGTPIGGNVTVTTPGQYEFTTTPMVATLAGGGFAVAWGWSASGDIGQTLYAQSFTAAGVATGSPIIVNPNTTGQGAVVANVIGMADGGFVVDWGETINVNGQMTGFAYQQHFDASGHRVGNELLVPSTAETFLADGGGVFNFTTITQYTQVHIANQQLTAASDFHYLAENGEVVFGSPNDTLVLAPADKVGLAASLLGGGGAGVDTLELATSGVADLTGPLAFSGFEHVLGSAGDDTFLVSQARIAGILDIDGDGGINVVRLAAAGSLDLTGLSLINIARVEGSAGADALTGGAGDDILKGGGGNDVLKGATGKDIALYGLASTAATWVHNSDGSWTVTAGAEGTDTLTGIEVLRFTDKDITLGVRPVPSDFNLDGKSDVLWRNDTGELYVWNSQSGQGAFLGQTLGNPGTQWHVQAVGDYDGDGKADVLWRNNAGDLYAYRSDDGQGVSFTGQSISYVDPVWAIVPHAGDFDGDGRADILYRNSNTGEVYLWDSNTGADVSFTGQSLGFVPQEWSIKALDDFNGDGRADVLWRSDVGDVYVWAAAGGDNAVTMNGQSIGYIPNDWTILGTGDFNGDGRADILWRHAGDGELYVWNSQLGSSAVNFLGQSLGVVGLDWSVAAIGDYDGDGRADVLFRNADGRVYVWNSNDTGPVAFQGQGLGTTPTDWHILSDFHGM